MTLFINYFLYVIYSTLFFQILENIKIINSVLTNHIKFFSFSSKSHTNKPSCLNLAIGNLYTFGSYPHESDTIHKKINWRILDIQNNCLLLLSDMILDTKTYNNVNLITDWNTCSLNKWLNTDFYNCAFSSKEKKQIINCISEYQKYNLLDFYDCNKIFLLNHNDVFKYLSCNNKNIEEQKDEWYYDLGGKQAAAYGTEFAKKNHLYVDSTNHRSVWWLRSSGISGERAMSIYDEGYLHARGDYIICEGFGVRPAIWIKINT